MYSQIFNYIQFEYILLIAGITEWQSDFIFKFSKLKFKDYNFIKIFHKKNYHIVVGFLERLYSIRNITYTHDFMLLIFPELRV